MTARIKARLHTVGAIACLAAGVSAACWSPGLIVVGLMGALLLWSGGRHHQAEHDRITAACETARQRAIVIPDPSPPPDIPQGVYDEAFADIILNYDQETA